MAGDVKLEVKVEENRVLITWRDALNNHVSKDFVRNLLLVIWFIFTIIGMLYGLGNGSLAPMLWIALGLVFVLFAPIVLVPDFLYVPRFVSLSKTTFKTGFGDAPIQDISRIEYGLRGEWDKSDKDRENRNQVRAWVKDEYPIIIAENDWTSEVNHRLRDKIAKALNDGRTAKKKKVQKAEFGDVKGDFGIPDY